MHLVWLSGIAAIALFCGIAWYLAPLEPSIVALQLAFSPQSFAAIVHAWPAEHLERFRAHLPFDFALLFAYGAFGYLLATRTGLFAQPMHGLGRHARWWLPAAAAFDGVENLLHWWLTASPRFGVPQIYGLSASASLIKWALLMGFGALTAYAVTTRRT